MVVQSTWSENPEDRFSRNAAQIMSDFEDYSIKWHRDRTNTIEHVFMPREYSVQHGQPPSLTNLLLPHNDRIMSVYGVLTTNTK